MKKLCLVLAILFAVSAGVVFAAQPGINQNPGVGEIVQRGYPSDPPKRFRMVRYIGDSTLAAKSFVIWHLTEDDGVTIDTSTTTGDSAAAGVIVTAALSREVEGNTALEDVGRQNWTWLQTYGYCSAVTSNNIIAAGDAIGATTTAGRVAAFLASTSAAGKNGYAGFAYDAIDTAATGEIFLKCE